MATQTPMVNAMITKKFAPGIVDSWAELCSSPEVCSQAIILGSIKRQNALDIFGQMLVITAGGRGAGELERKG